MSDLVILEDDPTQIQQSGQYPIVPSGHLYLEIDGFRRLGKRKILFKEGFTWIKGNNGSGKTSIVDSIEFALYGGNRDIYPPGTTSDKKRSCKVLMIFDGLIIRRETNPTHFSVVMDQVVYMDPTAQQIINTRFGSKNLYQCSTHVEQFTLNPFMSDSQEIRLEVLRELSTTSHLVAAKIALIQKTAFEQRSMLNQKTAEYQAGLQLYNANCQRLNGLKIPSREELEKTIEENTKQVTALEVSKNFDKQRLELETKLREITNVLGEISEPDENQINQLSLEIERLRNLYLESKANEDLKLRIKEVPEAQEVSQSELLIAQQAEFAYQAAQKQFRDVGIAYDQAALDSAISIISQKLEVAIRDEALQGIYANLQTLKVSLSRLPVVESVLQESVDLLTQQLNSLTLCANVLECPECHSHLTLQGPMLIKSSRARSSPQEIQETQKKLELLRQQKYHADERARLEAQINSLSSSLPQGYVPSGLNCIQLQNLMNVLRQMRYLEPPKRSYSDLLRQYNAYQAYKEYLRLKSSVKSMQKPEEILSNLDQMTKELVSLQKQRKLFQDAQNHRVYKEQLERLPPPYTGPAEAQLISERTRLNEQLRYCSEIEATRRHYDSLVVQGNELANLSRFVAGIEALEKKCPYAESSVLEKTAVIVNQTLANVIPKIFSEPMIVTIDMFKQNTTDGKVKPNVNLKIMLDSIVYPSYKALSVGMMMRLSIAIALTFVSLRNLKLFIVDEANASVDENARPRTLDTIRSILEKRTVLMMDHTNIYDPDMNVLQL